MQAADAECFSKLKLALLLFVAEQQFEYSAAEQFVVEKIAEKFVDNFAEIVVVAEKLVENYWNQSDYYYLD